MTITHACPSCGHEFDVECTPAVKGRYHGRPEDCYPDEGASIEPDECPNCALELDIDAVLEQASEEAEKYAGTDED